MPTLMGWVRGNRGLTIALVVAMAVAWGREQIRDAAPYPIDSEHVTIFRLGRRSVFDSQRPDQMLIDGYPVRQVIESPDEPVRRKIAALLHSASTYSHLPISYLCFDPGMAVRFGSGKDEVDVLICTDCDHAYFYKGDEVAYLDLSAIGSWRLGSFYHQLFGWPAAEPMNVGPLPGTTLPATSQAAIQ